MIFVKNVLKKIQFSKPILDSGKRKIFETGAVRDVSEGKGRCDLLPLHVVGELIESDVLTRIEVFKKHKEVLLLYASIRAFADEETKDICTLMLDVSKHFEAGAGKYGENNWMKGIPLHHYIDSAVRHYLKHKRGDTDEAHDRAFVWNLMCAIWTKVNKPELDDIWKDI